MVVIAKAVKAYILLEGLIGLGVMVTLTSLVLGQFHQQQVLLAREQERQEVLQVAAMAVQTQQTQLTLNGVQVQLLEGETGIVVYSDGEEVLRLEEVP